jgi:cytochrome c oxidase cbb3-type subunit 3
MSDFTTIFWDYFVALLTIIGVIGCGIFLKLQSKRRVLVRQGAEPETTGHVWDEDLREYHNPMPAWWIWLFYLTIVFSVVYLVLFPGLGTQFKGTLNWTSAGQHAEEVQLAEEKYGPLLAQYLAQPLPQVAGDPQARQMGERIFLNNCAQCHGSDARGAKGFPNLADKEWLYGGSPEAIQTSVVSGRRGTMPSMAVAVGGGDNVTDVAHYVLSLSGSSHDPVRAIRGKTKFTACAACHGTDGTGNRQLGAPDLSNRAWLYGGSATTIAETINKGRQGVMPAWKDVLSDAEIHLVSAYVFSLSNPAVAAVKP